MPLRANGSDGKEYRIYGDSDEERNSILNIRDKIQFSCPHCSGSMVFVNTTTCIYHFRHEVTCIYQTEPETQRHIEMKQYFASLLPGAITEQRVGNRIADVYLSGGIVVECQVSHISIQEIIERTIDYNIAGHPVLWVFGHRNENGLEFSTREDRRYIHATEREKFIQSVCGASFYHTDSGIFVGKLYGNKKRKKMIFGEVVSPLRYAIQKYSGKVWLNANIYDGSSETYWRWLQENEMEFIRIRGEKKSNPDLEDLNKFKKAWNETRWL